VHYFLEATWMNFASTKTKKAMNTTQIIHEVEPGISQETTNFNVFNDFDFQIMQLQAEVEFMKLERGKLAKFHEGKFEAKLLEFDVRWYAEIAEESSMNLNKINNRIWVHGSIYEGNMFQLNKNDSWIAFNFMHKTYEFSLHKNDEYDDIDFQDFQIHANRINIDDLMKLNIVFNELESLMPNLIRWNREIESIYNEIAVEVMHTNLELNKIDKQLKELRLKIEKTRAESFLAGNVIDFKNEGVRKFYYNSRRFEFVEQIKLIDISDSGKTCNVEVIALSKYFQCTSYHPMSDTGKRMEFNKVWISSIISNFYELR